MRNNAGFTLIEMLLVLGALSIMVLLSAPIKVSILDNQKEEQFLTTFQNDLLYLQSISYLSPHDIEMEFTKNHYKIRDGFKNNYVLTRKIPPGWEFDLFNLRDKGISFTRSGTIRQPGTILLTTNKSTYRIVFPFGKGRCHIEKL